MVKFIKSHSFYQFSKIEKYNKSEIAPKIPLR